MHEGDDQQESRCCRSSTSSTGESLREIKPSCPARNEYERVLVELLSLPNIEASPPQSVNAEATFRLDRMRALATVLGDPQHAFRCVHVAGSKGKGSTCEMIASGLQACGCVVGLYTSPHLIDIRERIRVSGEMIDRDTFVRIGRVVLDARKRIDRSLGEVTTFEALTMLAFLHFAEQAVDVGVVEVGMGGLHDATNILHADVCVVTSIQLEHTQFLGDSLESIAGHKSGIIKHGCTSITLEQPPGVLEVIRGMAEASGSTLGVLGQGRLQFSMRQDTTSDRGLHYKVTLSTPDSLFEQVPVALRGESQARNAGLALAVFDALRAKGMSLPEASLAQGLSRTRAPGRLEKICERPRVYIDVAHTPESLEATLRSIGPFIGCDALLVVFGCNADKNLNGLMHALSRAADKAFFTRAEGVMRAADPRELHRRFSDISQRPSAWTPGLREAINMACRSCGPGDLILCTGSFAIAGEAKRMILEKGRCCD